VVLGAQMPVDCHAPRCNGHETVTTVGRAGVGVHSRAACPEERRRRMSEAIQESTGADGPDHLAAD